MGYRDLVNRFSTTKVGSRVARATAARVDPWIYRRSKGRFTFTGVPTIPMLLLTTTGARSGAPRAVQLGYLADGDDFVVVASNFGQGHHPAWMRNLLAHPDARVQHGPEEFPVRAEVVSDGEREELWPRIEAALPQMRVYRTRTTRDLRVFRLRRGSAGDA